MWRVARVRLWIAAALVDLDVSCLSSDRFGKICYPEMGCASIITPRAVTDSASCYVTHSARPRNESPRAAACLLLLLLLLVLAKTRRPDR